MEGLAGIGPASLSSGGKMLGHLIVLVPIVVILAIEVKIIIKKR